MGEMSALSKGRPSRGRSGGWPGGDAYWKAPPPAITPRRTPGGRPGGGTISTPTNDWLRDRKPISTSWLLAKMRIRHLSYISTDLFWTKISTANPKVAFLPLCARLFVWEKRFCIQSHKFFAIQNICGSVTKKILVQNSKSNKPPTGQSLSQLVT